MPDAAYVPYQAYKPKRHSRTFSNPILTPNVSPPPLSTATPPRFDDDKPTATFADNEPTSGNQLRVLVTTPLFNELSPGTQEPQPSINLARLEHLSSPQPPVTDGLHFSQAQDLKGKGITWDSPSLPMKPLSNPPSPSTDSLVQAPPAVFDASAAPVKKASKFRRVPPRNVRSPQFSPLGPTPGHSRNASSSSEPPRPSNGVNSSPKIYHANAHIAPANDTACLPSFSAPPRPIPPILPAEALRANVITSPSHFVDSSPHDYTPSVLNSRSVSSSSDAAAKTPPLTSQVTMPRRHPTAPYRPGFQPKGVYRPLTDDFISLRILKHGGEGDEKGKKVERTKLERRLEKLIVLHFSSPSEGDKSKDPISARKRPPHENRRASSFFDFDSLKNISINNSGGLWRGVVSGGLNDGGKQDIRVAEQRITPWQDDAVVGKCPLCEASFHPLTNRKHHCRLCGQIICSLPIKQPQRPQACSLLFVVDAQTRQIEEVGEGVDYGVRKRRSGTPGQEQEDEEKFLKGVRICGECRPIILRQQYVRQHQQMPPFVKLYEDFINLEKDIEESLPQFQELLLSLSHNDQPTKEASAARKRLLEAFRQYDNLAKQIRGLPCPNGPGSSQDRVQLAIMTRANLFLQKNMFPLQSLPTTNERASKATTNSKQVENSNGPIKPDIDPDSELAHTLQPLLEQETLLETFVEEAKIQRKFEDVKTLKTNLKEIRHEIERLIARDGGANR